MVPRPQPLEQPDLNNYVADTSWSTTKWTGIFNKDALLERLTRGLFNEAHTFMLSKPHFDDNDVEQDWEPLRVLGKGGFGVVGAWQRKDAAGTVVDELAVKEIALKTSDGNPAAHEIYHVSGTNGMWREAVIQNELQRHSANIHRLRRYKYFQHESKHRLYSTYCPHGDLGDLWLLHRVFDRHIPEPYLYHCFENLAHACWAMEQPPDPQSHIVKELKPDVDGDPGYCLHLDFDYGNVFMDYAKDPTDQNDIFSTYPQACLADFGLSKYTSITDAGQRADHTRKQFTSFRGKPYCHAPEQIYLGATWKPPLHDYRLGRFSYDPRVNTFCMGKVMYDLVGLKTWKDIHNQLENLTQAQYNSPEYEEHFLRPKKQSTTLDLLLRMCLRPNRVSRADAQAVLSQLPLVKEQWRGFARTARGLPDQRSYISMTLAVDYNEMRDRGPGNARVGATFPEAIELAENLAKDPEQGRFVLPRLPQYDRWATDFVFGHHSENETFYHPDGRVAFGEDAVRLRAEHEKRERGRSGVQAVGNLLQAMAERERGLAEQRDAEEEYRRQLEEHDRQEAQHREDAELERRAEELQQQQQQQQQAAQQQQGAQQQQAHPQRQDRTAARADEYMAMTAARMQAELKHRKVKVKPMPSRKRELAVLLAEADADGNEGRGVWLPVAKRRRVGGR